MEKTKHGEPMKRNKSLVCLSIIVNFYVLRSALSLSERQKMNAKARVFTQHGKINRIIFLYLFIVWKLVFSDLP